MNLLSMSSLILLVAANRIHSSQLMYSGEIGPRSVGVVLVLPAMAT